MDRSLHDRGHRHRALHRPGLSVRVLRRADPAAVALALRRRPALAHDHDRADPRARRGGEAAGERPVCSAKYGMPIDPAPYPEPSSSEPACRAVVAARLNAPGRGAARCCAACGCGAMDGGLLDDPELIAAAATDVGLDPVELARVGATRRAWRTRCRPTSPAPATPPGGPRARPQARRPACSSAATRRRATSSVRRRTFSLPGFNPVEAYEAVIANLTRRWPAGRSRSRSSELLRWFDEPLATAEVEAIMGRAVAHAARPGGDADPGRRGLLLEALKHARVVLVPAHLVAHDRHPGRQRRG